MAQSRSTKVRNPAQLSVPVDPWAQHDVRRGGTWTAGQRFKNNVLFACVRLALAASDLVPEVWLLGLGRLLGLLAYFGRTELRRRTLHNLTAALPEREPDPLSRRVFVSAGKNLARTLMLRRHRFRVSDRVHIGKRSRRLLSRRHPGAIFVSAHLGPYEWIAALLAELGCRPSVVVRESYDPRLDRVIDQHRVGRGVQVIHRGAPTSGLQTLRALRDGRPVGFLTDLGARVPSMEVDILGHPLALPIGPQQLALRLGRPILFGTLTKSHDATRPFELRVVEISTHGSLAQVTQRVADALSAAIRCCPEQWLWMARSFPTFAPPCSAALQSSR